MLQTWRLKKATKLYQANAAELQATQVYGKINAGVKNSARHAYVSGGVH
jgi:hypothetical protein